MMKFLYIIAFTLGMSAATNATMFMDTEKTKQQYHFGAQGQHSPFTFEATGLSGIEGGHRWTEGEERVASFTIPHVQGANRVSQVVFENVGVLVPQRVTVLLNDEEVGNIDYTEQTLIQSIAVKFPNHLKEAAVIKFLMPGACLPKCNPDDPRILGLCLTTMQLLMDSYASNLSTDSQGKVSTFVDTEETMKQLCIGYHFGVQGQYSPFTFQATGLSGKEGGHRWTEGEKRVASFTIPHVQGSNRVDQVVFENVGVLVPQRVTVLLNDEEVGNIDFTAQKLIQSIAVKFPNHLKEAAVIKFLTPGACLPQCNPDDPRILGLCLTTMALLMDNDVPHMNADSREKDAIMKEFNAVRQKALLAQKREMEKLLPNNYLERFLSSLVFLTGSTYRVINKALRIEKARNESSPDRFFKYVLNQEELHTFQSEIELYLKRIQENAITEEEVEGFFRTYFASVQWRSKFLNAYNILYRQASLAIYRDPEFEHTGAPTCLDHYVAQCSELHPSSTWISIDNYQVQLSQGWKLHVSAKSATALKILLLVKPILEECGVHYKFAGSMASLNWLNEMIDQRGKFIAIYPNSDQEAADIARKIDLALSECPLRDFVTIPYDAPLGKSGGLYTRYGAFTTPYLVEKNPVTGEETFHGDRRIGPYRPKWLQNHPFGELLGEPEKPEARYGA